MGPFVPLPLLLPAVAAVRYGPAPPPLVLCSVCFMSPGFTCEAALAEVLSFILPCPSQNSGSAKAECRWWTGCILVVSHLVLVLNIRKHPEVRTEVLQESHHYSVVQKLLCILTASLFSPIMLIYVL